VTPPATEPISVTEAKAWARVDQQLDDVIIAGLIASVRQQFDGKDAWFGRALLTQTWDLVLDRFPGPPPYDASWSIIVPLPPLQSVLSITYLDSAGASIVLPPTDYVVDTVSEPGRIVPAFGKIWPMTGGNRINTVTVRFVAGYGDQPSDVPQAIRDWLKQAIAYLYDHREAADLPNSFFWSMAGYRASWAL
jgi:uncharacterized phiE125 gp8 family phage protein